MVWSLARPAGKIALLGWPPSFLSYDPNHKTGYQKNPSRWSGSGQVPGPPNTSRQYMTTILNRSCPPNIGTLIIRIGSSGPYYYNYNKDPPPKKKKNSIGNYKAPILLRPWALRTASKLNTDPCTPLRA